MRWRPAAAAVTALVLASACQSSTAPPPTPSAAPICPDRLDGQEFAGRAPAGESLWGLLFEAYPIARGTEAKIAWHVTGTGRVTITATGPDHLEIKPAWGPEAHLSSNWERPGDEWGTGFVFPAAGCWTVRFERGKSVSTASLLVADTPA